MAGPKRKRTAAESRFLRERKKDFQMIFINGQQVRVRRPPLIDGVPVEEFIARNASAIELHEYGLWELMTPVEEMGEWTDLDSFHQGEGE